MCEIPLHNVQGIQTNQLSLSKNPYFTTDQQKSKNLKKNEEKSAKNVTRGRVPMNHRSGM